MRLTPAQKRALKTHDRTSDDGGVTWRYQIIGGVDGKVNYRTMVALEKLGLVDDLRTYGKPSNPTMLCYALLTELGELEREELLRGWRP